MNFEEKLKELQVKYKALGDEIDELIIAKQEAKKNPKNRFWKPKIDEKYYYIDVTFYCKFTNHDGVKFDNELINNANCYSESEKELAEKDAAKNQARQIIQRTADELHGERYYFDFYRYNYVVTYDDCGKFDVERLVSTNVGAIVFDTKELAEKCLELCREEYKILLGVE